MSSGNRKVVINTRERAVSSDINRLQQFAAADRMEAWRYLLDVSRSTDDIAAGAISTEHASQESPVRALILSGFMARPQLASQSVLVDSGLLFMLDPDGATLLLPGGANSPDDSLLKDVADPGVVSLGQLVIASNASGSIRIDVIEAQRNPDIAQETASRDIFDPATGLFSATTVDKVTSDGLTYRVRQGVAGSGFPGTVQGWLPLAVASVPNGSTTNDTVTFWDVRPLINHRDSMINEDHQCSKFVRQVTNMNGTSGHLTGVSERVYRNQKLGGNLLRSSPGTDNAYLDILDAVNQSPGFSLVSYWYLYALTPFGLPNWARYTDASSGSRIPRSPRGLLILSNVTPVPVRGVPSAAFALPVALGLGATTTAAGVVICSGNSNTATVSAGGITWLRDGFSANAAAGTNNPDDAAVTFQAGVHFPADATAILVKMEVVWSHGVDTSARVDHAFDANGVSIVNAFEYEGTNLAASNKVSRDTFWVPLAPAYPATSLSNATVTWYHNIATNAVDNFETVTTSACDGIVLAYKVD